VEHLSSPCRVLWSHLQTDHAQSRFARLGFEFLAQQASWDSFGIGADLWTYLLPQLSSVNLTINAAIASLGATYEAVVLRPDHQLSLYNSLATVQYHKALASLQSDILLQTHGPIPLFLASILLAAVEVLLSHLTNALTHLRGAFTILTDCIYRSGQSRPASPWGWRGDKGEQRVTNDDGSALYLIAQALDIQTATYALSKAPELPSSSITSDHLALGTLANSFSRNQAHSELLPLLHACYHHTSIASNYKYLPRADIPSHIALDQSRYLALLSQWLSRLDHHTSTPTGQDMSSGQFAAPTPPRFPLLVLRIQCISALIYLSTVLSPKEMAYDFFTSFFQQIVDGATVLLDSRSPGGCLNSLQNRFRLISPPLYLTAMKCRQGAIRRRAIHLLGLTGREGPWYGAVFVRVALRAVEIEEGQKGALLLDPGMKDMGSDAITVPESTRLHGSGISSVIAGLPSGGFIEAHFSRCVDAEHMVTRSDVPWDSEENWDMWTERITMYWELPTDQSPRQRSLSFD
jgi:hypothetical protein